MEDEKLYLFIDDTDFIDEKDLPEPTKKQETEAKNFRDQIMKDKKEFLNQFNKNND